MVTFVARRGQPHLVAPARPTPRETKTLSDMDDHPGNRAYVPLVEFFVRDATGEDEDGRGRGPEDPAMAVRAALAEALVYYYPVAGRMRETAGGKLVVDCTGEGVPFVEADAAVRLEELGAPPLPPYPSVEELLCDGAGDSYVVVGKPIVFVQVTRFRCGGFAIGLRINHCIADGFGMIQFLRAVADVARGESAPAVLPVWERHLLMARAPPSTAHVHRKLTSFLKDPAAAAGAPSPPAPASSMVCRRFLFGPAEISALRRRVAEDDDDGDLAAAPCTRFELLTAAIWRCRAAAWGLAGDRRAVLVFVENARRRWGRVVPRGYYGNALVFHVADAAAGDLRGAPLGRAVALVREAKADASEEHLRSTADFMAAMRAMPPAAYHEETYMVSDWTRLGEDEVDFGWARRAAGGVAMPPSPLVSFNARCVNSDGDESVVVTMQLPEAVMERFEEEIAIWLKN